jgi:hypothetical protein
VSTELPRGGAIALATLEPRSGVHGFEVRPELTFDQHGREIAHPAPKPLGKATGDNGPVRERNVARRSRAEPEGPEPDGFVDHALGLRCWGCADRLGIEPKPLQARKALLVR